MEFPFKSQEKKVIEIEGLKPRHPGEHEVHDRHSLISGWDQKKIANSRIGIIGCGGLGGIYSKNLARMGVGHLTICDSDHIELSNLSRQPYYEEQIGENKTLILQEILRKECTGKTRIEAYSMDFQNVVTEHTSAYKNLNLLACLVDNENTRHDASVYGLTYDIPVLFSAVSKDTRCGYVFIQDKNGPCFNCIYPKQNQITQNTQCRDPAVIYIHTAIMGIAIYPTVCKILNWKLPWNFFHLSLTSESVVTKFQKRDNCEVCRS